MIGLASAYGKAKKKEELKQLELNLKYNKWKKLYIK